MPGSFTDFCLLRKLNIAISLSIYFYLSPSVSIYFYLFRYFFIYQSILSIFDLSIYLVYLSIYLPTYLYIQSIYLSIYYVSILLSNIDLKFFDGIVKTKRLLVMDRREGGGMKYNSNPFNFYSGKLVNMFSYL